MFAYPFKKGGIKTGCPTSINAQLSSTELARQTWLQPVFRAQPGSTLSGHWLSSAMIHLLDNHKRRNKMRFKSISSDLLVTILTLVALTFSSLGITPARAASGNSANSGDGIYNSFGAP
jgi:hypothetical protein